MTRPPRAAAAAVGASACRVYLFVVQDLLAYGHPPFHVGPRYFTCGSRPTPPSPLVHRRWYGHANGRAVRTIGGRGPGSRKAELAEQPVVVRKLMRRPSILCYGWVVVAGGGDGIIVVGLRMGSTRHVGHGARAWSCRASRDGQVLENNLRVTLQGFAVLGSFRVLCRTFLNAYYSKSQIVTRPPLDPELFSLDIVSDVY